MTGKSIFAIAFLPLCLLTNPSLGQGSTPRYSIPGFVQLNDSVFISATEIDIREYARFLVIGRKISGDPTFIQKCMPFPNYLGWIYRNRFSKDSSLIIFGEQYEIAYKDSLYNWRMDTSVSFNAFLGGWPVVNVTKQQANEYCAFRTKDYRYFWTSLKRRHQGRYPPSLYFRLPTTAEWMMAASAGLDTTIYKYGTKEAADKTPIVMYRDTCSADIACESHPVNVNRGYRNQSQLYNMCGNVGELVADDEFVYGGSFRDPLSDCTVTSRKPFTRPGNHIGFRVVAVLKN